MQPYLGGFPKAKEEKESLPNQPRRQAAAVDSLATHIQRGNSAFSDWFKVFIECDGGRKHWITNIVSVWNHFLA